MAASVILCRCPCCAGRGGWGLSTSPNEVILFSGRPWWREERGCPTYLGDCIIITTHVALGCSFSSCLAMVAREGTRTARSSLCSGEGRGASGVSAPLGNSQATASIHFCYPWSEGLRLARQQYLSEHHLPPTEDLLQPCRVPSSLYSIVVLFPVSAGVAPPRGCSLPARCKDLIVFFAIFLGCSVWILL
jgi:hypothetical protein